MPLTQLDYTAHRTLQRALHDHLTGFQWEGRDVHPRAIGWAEVGDALDMALTALEAAGYRVVKT